MSHSRQLAVQAISGRTRLITEVQRSVPLFETGDHAPDGCGLRVDLAQVSDLTLPFALSNRDRVAELGNVQPYENLAMLIHRLCLSTARPLR